MKLCIFVQSLFNFSSPCSVTFFELQVYAVRWWTVPAVIIRVRPGMWRLLTPTFFVLREGIKSEFGEGLQSACGSLARVEPLSEDIAPAARSSHSLIMQKPQIIYSQCTWTFAELHHPHKTELLQIEINGRVRPFITITTESFPLPSAERRLFPEVLTSTTITISR